MVITRRAWFYHYLILQLIELNNAICTVLNIDFISAKPASECQHTAVEDIFRHERVTKPSLILSHMSVYKPENSLQCLSMDSFTELAKSYRLVGEPPNILCEYNADVASRVQCLEIAQAWRMLQYMCLTVLPGVPSVAAVLQSAGPVTAVQQPSVAPAIESGQ